MLKTGEYRAHHKAQGRKVMSQSGKSDRGVGPKQLPNKGAREVPAVVEGRPRAQGNAVQLHRTRRARRVDDVHTALDGIRQTAQGLTGPKFTILLPSIFPVERRRAAYAARKRDAAAGVNGHTWAGAAIAPSP
jgi:RNA-directed DNA polymerase